MTEGPNPGYPNEQAGPGVPPGGAAPPPPPYGGYGTYGSYGAYGGGAYGGQGGQGAYGPPGAGGYGAYGGGPYGRPSAPKPGLVPLRPLTLGEILDGAFTAIRWNPKTILASSAVVATV